MQIQANMDAPIQLIPEPLRTVEIVGCDGAAAQSMAEAMQCFGVLLMHTHPFINLEHIERVVVGMNYPLAVQRYKAQAEVFASNFLQLADVAEGLAFATEGGVIVLVRGDMLLGTLSGAPSTVAACSRLIVHELCHGHDLGQMRHWLWNAATNRALVHEATIYWLCHTLWAEYFGNRYSYFCAPTLTEEWTRLGLLLDRLPGADPLHAAKQIAMTFGYALGSLAAEGARLEDLRPDIVQRLRARGLWAAWFEASTVTERLAQSGECWEHEAGMLQLQTAARLIVNTCRYGLR